MQASPGMGVAAIVALWVGLGSAPAFAAGSEQPREKIAVFDAISEGVDPAFAGRVAGLVNERLIKVGGFVVIHEDVARAALDTHGSTAAECLRSAICLRDTAEFLEADLYITAVLQKAGSGMELQLELALPSRSDLQFASRAGLKRASELKPAVTRAVDDLLKQFRAPKRSASRRPVSTDTEEPAAAADERAPPPAVAPTPPPPAKPAAPVLHRVRVQSLSVEGVPAKLAKSGTRYLERQLAKRADVYLVRGSKGAVEWVASGILARARRGFRLTITLTRADGTGVPISATETMQKLKSLNLNIDLCVERLLSSKEWQAGVPGH